MLDDLLLESLAKDLLVALLQIMVIEPEEALDVEVCTVLRAMRKVEQTNHLVHGHDVLVVAWVPAQESQEVDDGLGQIAFLAIAAVGTGRLAGLLVADGPLEGEHGEAILVAIALRELAIAFGSKEQWQVGKLRSLPAESTIEQHMKG